MIICKTPESLQIPSFSQLMESLSVHLQNSFKRRVAGTLSNQSHGAAPGSKSLAPVPDSSFLLLQTPGSNCNGSVGQIPSVHPGNLDWVTLPASAQPLGIWEPVSRWGLSLPVSRSMFLSLLLPLNEIKITQAESSETHLRIWCMHKSSGLDSSCIRFSPSYSHIVFCKL